MSRSGFADQGGFALASCEGLDGDEAAAGRSAGYELRGER